MRDIQAGRLRNGNQENSALQPGGLYCSRNQNICIDHQTEGKHYCFDFWERAFLIILSISREFNALVRFRSDSSPRSLTESRIIQRQASQKERPACFKKENGSWGEPRTRAMPLQIAASASARSSAQRLANSCPLIFPHSVSTGLRSGA